MPKRRLVLNREALTALESEELASIAAAGIISTNPGLVCQVFYLASVQRTNCPTCLC